MAIPSIKHYSKAFDAMPYGILVTKRNAYSMANETVTLLASYLRNQKAGNCENDRDPKGLPLDLLWALYYLICS